MTFTDSCCLIQDLNQRIGKGRWIGNLDLLEPFDPSPNFAFCFSSSKTVLWHSRLGHPSYSRMHLLNCVLGISSQNEEDSTMHCKVCHQAKQWKPTFPLNRTIADWPFDLVHLDVWGPFATPIIAGHKYFLTLVDDHSRATWVYLLQSKSIIHSIFPAFYHFMQTQFAISIKAIRSDNAPELMFHDFLQSKGVFAYHSCPDTP